uniref:Uncharacterized protein n=1 Tax=Tanacetum cinerariifolium TaxID=118510 RepID=A0A699QSX4_TANCI|nr:hypothetical protein [Tanacetum cinerariifolium]
MDVDTQGRMKEDVTTEPEPKVFNNEEVTLTMAQTLTKMKVEKQRILDEQMAKGYMMKKLSKMLLEKGKNKNMAGYKIQYFKGMTYDQVRPISEKEYNNVQTFLKSDRDEEPSKKRVSKETLLWESYKKLRAEVEASGFHTTQEDTPTVDRTKISKDV